MPSLYAEIEIVASRKQVWQALIQKEKWMYWNTFLYDRDPELQFRRGEEVFLALRRTPDEEETEFQPTITLLEPESTLRWFSSIPGFQNQHIFEIQDMGMGRTKYVHRESFSGWMAQMIFPFIRQDELSGLRRMARELKQYVEQS